MDLEHHRKEAKRLLRQYRAGHAQAIARAEAVLGARAVERFRLTDAQHVIASERGYRSWRELRAAAAERPTETVIDTGLEYRPGDPVRVRIIRRPPRVSVTDAGAACARAGRSASWRETAARLARELDVNISRLGVVSLPVVAAGPGETAIIRRIGAASLRFYDALLELETQDAVAGRRLHSNEHDRRARRTDRNALPRA